MRMYDIIAKKRDGYELSRDEIKFVIDGYCKEVIPDYQMSALLMAIFINKMTSDETFWFTEAMIDSGETIDLSLIDGIKVDKHSTGGVGDKTTLVVAPLAAACGLKVAKMSGRGLGHTGGTLDKLESIPGFNVMLGIDDIIKYTNKTGVCIAGATANLVPADKKLYSLRDVTATVENTALIACSIMSKKIASGADVIILDVKYGSGAFMKHVEHAKALASEMIQIGKAFGRNTKAMVTNMDTPLGNSVGNSLEVIEAIEMLKGKGQNDFHELCIETVKHMLTATMNIDDNTANKTIQNALYTGKALKLFSEMIRNQGGDQRVIDDYSILSTASIKHNVKSRQAGYIKSIKTDDIGIAAMLLGAGRQKKDDIIDFSAGIVINKKTNDSVHKGDVLAELHTNKAEMLETVEDIIHNAYNISDVNSDYTPLIYEVL